MQLTAALCLPSLCNLTSISYDQGLISVLDGYHSKLPASIPNLFKPKSSSARMAILAKFAKLMKSEHQTPGRRNMRSVWIIDESKCLNMDEVRKLRKATSEMLEQGLHESRFSLIRTWFMIELGLYAGLRVGEMASLTHSDVLIDGEKSSLQVLGKGSKKRSVWLNAHLKKAIKEYSRYKVKAGYELTTSGFLLVNKRGEKISTRSLQKWFKRAVSRASLPSHYHVHCLRHTYTTFLLRASNNNYRFVQKQLGHASIRTTQVYAGVIESEGREAIEKLYS